MAPESACQRAACSDVEERRFSAASKRLKRNRALAPEGAEPSLRKLFSRAVTHCETIRAQAPEDRFHLSQPASRWLAKRVTPGGSRPPGKPVSTTFSPARQLSRQKYVDNGNPLSRNRLQSIPLRPDLRQVDIMDVVVFSPRQRRFLPSGTSQCVQSNSLFHNILRATPCRSIFCQTNGISSDANYHKARILLQGHKKNIQPIRRPSVCSGVRPS
jgi:hypothetical protein